MKLVDKLYLDMDGVLADFERHFFDRHGQSAKEYGERFGQVDFWQTVYEDPNFYRDMPPTQDMVDIVNICNSIASKVIILSSPSRTNQSLCVQQKREWLDKHLTKNTAAIFESKKEIYSQVGRILIDDSEGHCKRWEENGGTAHLYTDFQSFSYFIESLI